MGLFQSEGVMPAGTISGARDSITFAGTSAQRIVARRAWLNATLAATRDADVVFFDPDNGLEIPSAPMGSRNDHRFTFYSELAPFVNRGQSVGMYQHATRRGKIEDQAQLRAVEIRERLGVDDILCLRWRR